MSVRKIFIVLITIVVCVVIGAFVLNVLMPNAVAIMINTVENTLFNATGMKLDFNGDGTVATSATSNAVYTGNSDDTENVEANQGAANVAGYK